MCSQPAEGESVSRPSSSSSSSAQCLCAAPVDGAHTVGYTARCAGKLALLRLAGSKVDGKPTVSELCTLNLFWRNSIRKKTKRKTLNQTQFIETTITTINNYI